MPHTSETAPGLLQGFRISMSVLLVCLTFYACARNLEMMAVKAHGGATPFTSSSTDEPAHSDGMTPTGNGAIVSTPAAAGTLQQVPHSNSQLAEIRVSMEDLPNDMQSRLCTL